MSFAALRRAGVLGINRRNAEYTLRWNDRRNYPCVDDKLATKRLCERVGIPVPGLLAVARHHYELRGLLQQLESEDSFVLKPSRGAMGNGIVVVVGREPDRFLRAGGRSMGFEEFSYHASSIISGLYSLGGHLDAAMVEQRLQVHPEVAAFSADGVPDVRIIVYRGVPVMAMTRLPTRASGGRANLHQGALGVGVDLATGCTHHAVAHNRSVTLHPDTQQRVIGREIPAFQRVLEIAVQATDQTGLGYVGADVVVDGSRGPVILELNARPGLAIQLANRSGLRPRLAAVDAAAETDGSVAARVALGRSIAEACRREGAA